MKNLQIKKVALLGLLSICFIFTACSANKPSETPLGTDKNMETAKQPTETFTEQPSNKDTIEEYSDSVISCSYDSSILSYANINPSETLTYGTAFGKPNIDSKTIMSGTCLFVTQMKSGNKTSSTFSLIPEDLTKTLFDGVFGIDDKEYQAIVTKSPDDTYEYKLELKNKTMCKGKILSVADKYITLLVYRYLPNESVSYMDALNNCYDSIKIVPTTADSNDYTSDDHIAEIIEKAEKNSSMASNIESGPIFDSISSIYENVKLTDINSSISISLYLDKTTPKEVVENFFNIAKDICNKSNLESKYSGISFQLFVDEQHIADLILVNYTNEKDFSASEPITIIEEYESILDDSYKNNDFFYSHDISVKFDNFLDDK